MQMTSSRFNDKPRSKPGWWAVWLGAAFVVLFLINSFVFMPTSSNAPWRQVILPFYGIFMLLCGLLSGVMGLVAVTRQHERSWLVLLTLMPGLWVITMLLGEFLIPH